WEHDGTVLAIYFRITYAYSGDELTFKNWEWDTATGSYILLNYQIAILDGDMIVSSDGYDYNEDTEAFEITLKYEITYNSNGLATYISYKTYNDETSSWEELMYVESVYNANGMLTRSKDAMISMDVEMVLSEDLYEYNSNGQLTLEDNYMMSFITGELVKSSSNKYIYNNNVLVSKSDELYDEFTSGYTETNRYEYTYNTNASTSNLVLPIEVDENNGTSDFLDEDYYSSGLLLEVKHYNYSMLTDALELGTTASYYYSNTSTTPDESDDASLSELTIDGAIIDGFNSATYVYDIQLSEGSQDVPVVLVTTNNINATFTIEQASELPGTTTVVVTAEDGTQLTYTVNFEVDQNSDATLAGIQVDDEAIADFSPVAFVYSYGLPSGTANAPVVSATASNSSATVEISQAENSSGTATIQVTAEDGTTSNTYAISFFLIADSDANLAEIMVDGVNVDEFDATIYTYAIELPFGTTTIPEITALASNENASIEITQAADLPGEGVIVVTAADGETAQTYFIVYTIAQSNVATLSELSIVGSTIDNFDPEVFNYEVVLDYGTTEIPQISATASDANASIEITQATELPGEAIVEVTAEDGTVLSYIISFTISVGINEELLNEISIYPNPFKNQLNIDIAKNSEIESIAIYNQTGKRVYTSNQIKASGHFTIETNGLANGIYILSYRFVDGKNTQSKLSKF
ncbi:MAG: T9SS type A sorting domain-containing protein, partial [Prolixibacteraceae bacterium]|nr:T9SS type A sorting domain-containing protein [Prolixibacteraceae bacterium]